MRSLLLLGAAAALTLTTAAPASAAPTPGATYGGGQLPASFGKGGDNALLSAAVGADGRSVRVVGIVSVRCNRRPGAVQQFAADGQLAPDGRLRLQAPTRTYLYATAGSTPRGRATLDLGFEGAAASGTVRLTSSFRARGRRVRCDTTVPLTLRSAAPDASPAGPAPGGATLFGTGDKAYRGAAVPFGLRVSADGRRVNPMFAGTPLRCGRGLVDYLINSSPGRTIAAGGTFASRERFVLRFRGGASTTTIFRLTGRFTAQGVTGTYRARSTVRAPGRRTARCDSGTVRFSAVR